MNKNKKEVKTNNNDIINKNRRNRNVILSLKNVYKTYYLGKVPTNALDGVNLDIYEGEILVILGPSGSGKTTLLNLISGLDTPTSGDILYMDKNNIAKYSKRKITKFRKKHLGFIFQTYNLLEHLNVKENVAVGRKLGKSDVDVDEIIEIVGLKDHKRKYMHELSGGEQQRVSIARAIAKRPNILFADEPTGALDEKTGKKVLRTLVDVNKKYNTTMIIVTHNPGIAELADRIIYVNSGSITKSIQNQNKRAPEDISWG